MHAIVNQPGGKQYISAVFAYYKDVTATDDYQRYIESIHNTYYVVWNENHTTLIKWLVMVPNTKYIIPQILIVDSDQSDWIVNNDGEGCVNFLTRDIIDSVTESGEMPETVYKKCNSAYSDFLYNETPEIKDSQDIVNLMWATGCFHDARIVEKELDDSGTLHLHFDETWGCEVDVWLWGDLEYSTLSKDSNEFDPYWYGSSVFIQDGFVYFVDEDGMTVEEISSEYCYFKARHMKYKIIPDNH